MAGRFSSSSKRSDGPFSGMDCIGDLVGVVSATAGAGVGAGATGVAGFQLDLLAKCSTLRSSAKSGSKRDLATTAALCTAAPSSLDTSTYRS